MKSNSWNHKKSVSNRYNMLVECLSLGDNPEELEAYGTIEEMIKGSKIFKEGGATVSYIPINALESRQFPVRVVVDSQSQKEANTYTVMLNIERISEEPLYRIQDTKDIDHTCTARAFQRTRKLFPLPCCMHTIAAVMAAEDTIRKNMEEAGIENTKITSYYSEKDLLPVPDELMEFYETIKNEKQVERFTKLYEFFHSKAKIFRLN
ncbi:MAG: hypothetical protein ISS95_00455 [Candidatus Aenigmarchaeota archaeon]|nr:hypothetical protein [Candidatus Aenigmarchaeota archaeon]